MVGRTCTTGAMDFATLTDSARVLDSATRLDGSLQFTPPITGTISFVIGASSSSHLLVRRNADGVVSAESQIRDDPSPIDSESGTSLTVSAQVYLQGAYAEESSRLRTKLTGVLPQRQPYDVAPWNYPATTTVPHVPEFGLGGVTQTIVDWVLVELRTGTSGTGAAAAVPVTNGRAAGLLLHDGRIAGIDEQAATATAALLLDGVRVAAEVAQGSDVYVLIHHRNHLSVMTAAVAASAGCSVDYCADFRNQQSYAGCCQLPRVDGMYMMAAGDVNRSGVVSWGDDDLLLDNPGGAAYIPRGANYPVDGDVDFDGQVSANDNRPIVENHLPSAEACMPGH